MRLTILLTATVGEVAFHPKGDHKTPISTITLEQPTGLMLEANIRLPDDMPPALMEACITPMRNALVEKLDGYIRNGTLLRMAAGEIIPWAEKVVAG